MSPETIEPWQSIPKSCPKCTGDSHVDRFLSGVGHRDFHGEFSAVRPFADGAAEHLVVKCGTCNFERLMQPADTA